MRIPSLWRRLTAVFRRHDWNVEPSGVRLLLDRDPQSAAVKSSRLFTMLVCSRCGRMAEYEVFDRASFSSLYWSRGCSGRKTRAVEGGAAR